ncbi:e2f3 [Pungitius sinensis]
MASLSHTAAAASTPNPVARKSLFERSRCDTSLGFLTQRFAEMLSRSADGVLDLNLAAQQLNASKRRVYDVTNVLEGIHLIKKKSKNFIEWLGGDPNVRMDEELKALIEEERRLDELIQSCTKQVHQLCSKQNTRRFAYLTYEDVQRLPSLKEQTVIVIKAPAETKLEVPHPEESLQVHLSSTQGPIEAFLCSDDPVPMDAADGSASGGRASPLVPYSSFVQVSSKDYAIRTRGVDIISSLPSEPTRHSSPVTVSPVSHVHTPLQAPPGVQQSFITLNPPLALSLGGEEYSLSLTEKEGISNHFSCFDLDQTTPDVPLL